jgi:hypothetical protein
MRSGKFVVSVKFFLSFLVFNVNSCQSSSDAVWCLDASRRAVRSVSTPASQEKVASERLQTGMGRLKMRGEGLLKSFVGRSPQVESRFVRRCGSERKAETCTSAAIRTPFGRLAVQWPICLIFAHNSRKSYQEFTSTRALSSRTISNLIPRPLILISLSLVSTRRRRCYITNRCDGRGNCLTTIPKSKRIRITPRGPNGQKR